jgi:hypothetical protein
MQSGTALFSNSCSTNTGNNICDATKCSDRGPKQQKTHCRFSLVLSVATSPLQLTH